MDYNPQHWTRIEQELDKKRGNLRYYIGGGILTGVIVTAALLYPFTPNQPSTPAKSISEKATKLTTSTAPIEAPAKAMTNVVTVSKPASSSKITPLASLAGIFPTTGTATPQLQPSPEIITKKVSEGSITAEIKVSRTNGCAGEPFYFSVETNTPATLEWYFGDGKTSNLPNPSHSFNAGKYSVSLRVTSLIDGKTLKISNGSVITVNPKPSAAFTYNTDETEGFSRTLELVDQTKNSVATEWFVDGKPYRTEHPKITWNKKGNVPVALIVKNDLGCFDTLAQQITFNQEYNLLAPTAFTPNDDNQNDEFIPAALKNNDIAFRMEIIDPKNGGVIFTSTKQGWDGQNHTTGLKADQGSYIWVVTLIKPDNSKEVFKGNLSLLR